MLSFNLSINKKGPRIVLHLTFMHYLNFRIRQFYRAVQRAGIFYLLAALLLLSGVIFGLLELFSDLSANALVGIFIGINLYLFIIRKDRAFIEDMPHAKFKYYIVDHGLLSFPYLLLLLAFAKYQPCLLYTSDAADE